MGVGSFMLAPHLVHTRNAAENMVMTVKMPVEPYTMGKTLTHEHLFSNFGAAPEIAHLFDEEKLYNQVIPYLQKVKSLGCDTIVDCTTAYFGRRVDILYEISNKTGLSIITNTGYYGAANDKYIPPHAYSDNVNGIAEVWINEFKNGIDNSGIKPGFIKIGIDKGTLSEIDAKLVRAGAIAHRKTGLVMAVHTGNNAEAAEKQLLILKEENVHPGAWIWTHANKVINAEPLVSAAKKGAWISLDGIRDKESQMHHLNLLNKLKDNNLLNHVLLSHDGNGFPSGKEIRSFHALFTEFIALLTKHGYTSEEIKPSTE